MNNPFRQMLMDMALILVALVLVMAMIVGPSLGLSRDAERVIGVAIGVIALAGALSRVAGRPDELKASQSHRILAIASESLAHLRRGLDPESAQAVCRLILRETAPEMAAVAMTDRETVLGFAGLGEDHHIVGESILTRATREAVSSGEPRVLGSKEDIGCPVPGCKLHAAIVVPLEIRDLPVGTLKFYYVNSRSVNQTQLAMVEGLAELLSTQLELSELDRQTQLACAMELKALQAQIHPHFLFNTINTIASMIRTDPPHARELLREFAVFYRRTLESTEEAVTLGQEMDYVRSYLVFERARFGESKVRLEEFVTDEALAVEMPAFVVQPLVENAVQHGMPPDRPLTISVRGHVEDGALVVEVTDDGRGIPEQDLPKVFDPGFGKGLGIALKNVDDRLRGHFGPDSGLVISSEAGKRTVARLKVTLPSDPAGGETA